MRIVTRIVLATMLAVTANCARTNQQAAETTVAKSPDASLEKADQDAGNWLMYGRTYDDHRFSPLNQINEQTVSKLGLAWSKDFDTTRGLEGTPLVENGVIYTTSSWSVVHAFNAKTGESVWTYD